METKLKALFLMSLLSVAPAFGWEQPRNPDRFISLGLKIENYFASGDHTAVTQVSPLMPLVETGNAHEEYNGIGANLRLPATESVTLDLDYMYLNGEKTQNRDQNIYRESALLNGYKMSLGVRLYFNNR